MFFRENERITPLIRQQGTREYRHFTYIMEHWREHRLEALAVRLVVCIVINLRLSPQLSVAQIDKKIKTACGRDDFIQAGCHLLVEKQIKICKSNLGKGLDKRTYHQLGPSYVRIFIVTSHKTVFELPIAPMPPPPTIPVPVFQDREKIDKCPECHEEFGFGRKSRHCRHCLRVVCEKCTVKKVIVKIGRKIRLCTGCLTYIATEGE